MSAHFCPYCPALLASPGMVSAHVAQAHPTPNPEGGIMTTNEAQTSGEVTRGIWLDRMGNTWRKYLDGVFMMAADPTQAPERYAPFRRLLTEREWVAAAPDHQAEAPSDLIRELNDHAIRLRDYEDGEWDQELIDGWEEAADLLDRAASALAARPVVDDAAVERARIAWEARGYPKNMQKMLRVALRAALGGDQ